LVVLCLKIALIMCGIAGAISVDLTEEEIRLVLEAMLARLRHRGPDGCGMIIRKSNSCTVGLAHTRLAILDLSEAASQPMAGPSGPSWLVHNGEVYNFRELQRELKPLGCRFHTKSDTEVVLNAYEKWGIDCLTRFRGMFALGVWDEALSRLILARDP